nr:galactokinase [Acidobacteriota bacterium]
LLDCRSLELRTIPIPVDITLAICNTMVRHDLSSGEYNARRAECEQAVLSLRQVSPGIRALRDVTRSQLEAHRSLLSGNLYKRAHHVITENERVMQAADALQTGAVGRLSQLMADSHRSLRQDYEVSCPELDIMVEIATRQRGTLGARMTGGGFGGCAISMVETAHAQEFQHRVSAAYASATGLRPDIYLCKASRGAEIIGGDATVVKKRYAATTERPNS